MVTVQVTWSCEILYKRMIIIPKRFKVWFRPMPRLETQLRLAWNSLITSQSWMFSKAHAGLADTAPSLSSSLPLPGTPGKEKIYLSSPEVDNIRLQRGHADTGHNIHRCTADTDSLSLSLSLSLALCVCVCVCVSVSAQSNKHKHTQTQTHTGTYMGKPLTAKGETLQQLQVWYVATAAPISSFTEITAYTVEQYNL